MTHNIGLLLIFRLNIFNLKNIGIMIALLVIEMLVKNINVSNFGIHLFFTLTMPAIVSCQINYKIL